jgi:D-inositol-3-phosphate glycosyltransferase
MKIAYTAPHCWPDVRRGGERYLHELAASMARRGHDVTIWSTSTTAVGTAIEEGVRIVRLPTRARSDAALEQWFGPRLFPSLARQRYDVIHALMPSDGTAAIASRKLGRAGRAVYTNLGLPDRGLWARRHDRRFHDVVVRWIETYGCLSLAAASALESTFGRAAVITPGGVRLDRFRPSADKAERPTLLFSGTFSDPMKNVPLLLEALALLAKREPDVRLIMTGPGDPYVHLRAAPASVRDRVEILPLGTPDLAPVYSAAWLTVLPSKWESYALVLVESLACGTPVVATRHGASPERVRDGVGFLAEPDDVDDFADACAKGLELARSPGIAQRCRDVAAEDDWDALAPRYESIYRGDAPDGAANGHR